MAFIMQNVIKSFPFLLKKSMTWVLVGGFSTSFDKLDQDSVLRTQEKDHYVFPPLQIKNTNPRLVISKTR